MFSGTDVKQRHVLSPGRFWRSCPDPVQSAFSQMNGTNKADVRGPSSPGVLLYLYISSLEGTYGAAHVVLFIVFLTSLVSAASKKLKMLKINEPDIYK